MKSKQSWREVNPPKQYTDAELLHYGKRALAMRRVNQAISNGTLKRLSVCQLCGDPCETVAHHHKGYDYPFKVWWICRTCNANLHVHDGSLTLTQAIAYMRKYYADKVSHHMDAQRNYLRFGELCGVCGVGCQRIAMHEVDDMLICDHCHENLFETVQP